MLGFNLIEKNNNECEIYKVVLNNFRFIYLGKSLMSFIVLLLLMVARNALHGTLTAVCSTVWRSGDASY